MANELKNINVEIKDDGVVSMSMNSSKPEKNYRLNIKKRFQ